MQYGAFVRGTDHLNRGFASSIVAIVWFNHMLLVLKSKVSENNLNSKLLDSL